MVRAAVVGVGYLGKFHAEKYRRSTQAELLAVAEIDSRVGKSVARKYRAQHVSDYRHLPELGVQCASVVTQTSAHFEVAKWLLENGVDVLVEKPIAATPAEARELIAVAAKHERILQVGHLERVNPVFRAVQERLHSPRFFEARRIAPFSGRGTDVDVVMDLMIHDIDIIAHLVGRPLKRVDAVGIPILTDTVDIANARLTFEGGAVANVSASRAAFHSERTIRMFQSDLYISLDFKKKRLKMVSKSPGEKDDLGFPRMKVEQQKFKEGDALADEIEEFIKAVATRTPPLVGGEDGLRALLLTEQIHAAFSESIDEMTGMQLALKHGNAP